MGLMATGGEFVYRQVYAIKWNGSNGADVASVVGAIDVDDSVWSVAQETPGVHLKLLQYQASTRTSSHWVVTADRPWVVTAYDQGVLDTLDDRQYAARWLRQPALRAENLANTKAALLIDAEWQASLKTALGVAATPTLVKAVGAASLPVLTVANPSITVDVTLSRSLPLSVTAADVDWRAIAGAQVLSMIQLQDVANPIVLLTSGTPSRVTGVRFLLRTVGGVSVAGVLLCDVAKLV